MSIDYSQFYRGTTNINSYGSGVYKKDSIVKYEFNTADENGNKVMDKMSREETLQTMNSISELYGENVIVEFSGDGLAALVQGKIGLMNQPLTEEAQAEQAAKQAAFDSEVVQYDKSANYLPEYTGIYETDKAIATAVENCSQEEQAFVYDIIRQNFLVTNSSAMTEEERQANISLGMKKAEYAADNFIPENQKDSFLEAMETVAKLATSGRKNEDGTMDYGVNKANYLGHGSNLVYTTNTLDMMKQMDSGSYAEYQKISNEGSNEDRALNSLKYLTNWYVGAVRKNPNMVDQYDGKSKEYVSKTVKDEKVDDTFAGVKTDSKASFLESLKALQASSPNFLSLILNREISSPFWSKL